jgi:chromosome segregation ATPase
MNTPQPLNSQQLTQDVSQWLREISELKQHLADAQTAIKEAQKQGEHWRSLYNREAEQRRQDVQRGQERLAELEALLEQPRSLPQESEADRRRHYQQTLDGLDMSQLQEQLLDLSLERDRQQLQIQELEMALNAEQQNHQKTRSELTGALADAIALISKTKAEG